MNANTTVQQPRNPGTPGAPPRAERHRLLHRRPGDRRVQQAGRSCSSCPQEFQLSISRRPARSGFADRVGAARQLHNPNAATWTTSATTRRACPAAPATRVGASSTRGCSAGSRPTGCTGVERPKMYRPQTARERGPGLRPRHPGGAGRPEPTTWSASTGSPILLALYGKLSAECRHPRRAVWRWHHRLPDQSPSSARVTTSATTAASRSRGGHAEHHLPGDDLRHVADAFTNIPRSDDFTKANLGLSGSPCSTQAAVRSPIAAAVQLQRALSARQARRGTPPNSTEYGPFLNENPPRTCPEITKTLRPHHEGWRLLHDGFKPQSHRAPANGNISFQNDAATPTNNRALRQRRARYPPDLQPGGDSGSRASGFDNTSGGAGRTTGGPTIA